MACRITTYGLPVGAEAGAYVAAHLADPAFLAWRAAALTERYDPDPYPRDEVSAPWPGDA